MTCNVVDRAQMLIIGGTFPLTQDCDAAPQRGTHNLVLGAAAADNGGASASWDLYSPDRTAYAVPDTIASAVGGGPAGGATRTAPAAGFDNPDLDVLMTKRASVATRTPTRAIPTATGGSSSSSSSGTGLSTGTIVGAAVGGAVALAALLAGLCILVRRHRRRRRGGGEGYAAPGRGSKSSAGGSSGYPAYGPGSPWEPPSGIAGPRSPGGGSSSSHGSPLSPFARRPSNLNVQQGPVELAAPLDGGEFEMDEVGGAGGAGGGRGGGMMPRPLRLSSRTTTTTSLGGGHGGHGGAEGMAFAQPKFDDQGRPWYPQVSIVDGMMPSPTSHAPQHGGYSPGAVTPGSPPQELGTGRNTSVGGWSEGGKSSASRATSMRRGTSASGQDMTRRHDTFYHA